MNNTWLIQRKVEKEEMKDGNSKQKTTSKMIFSNPIININNHNKYKWSRYC